MGDKAKAPSVSASKAELPHGLPAMAGASNALDKPNTRKL
jgi:hypothetical protein